MRWLPPALLALTLLAPTQARAADPADHLDRATACRRRAKAKCVLTEADKALALLGTEGKVSLRREAAVLRAEALALLDRPDEAREAFGAALALWPEWTPASDADPRVVAAHEAASRGRLSERLPPRLELPPVPAPTPPSVVDLLPKPQLYAPKSIVELDVDALRERRFTLSIGAGATILGGASSDRFNVGATTGLDFTYAFDERWALLVSSVLSLHGFSEDFAAEPGYGRGLTTVTFVLGTRMTQPLVEALELTMALGVGAGLFGVRSASEAAGLAVQGALGARYRVHDRLGVRVEAIPTLIVPMGDEGIGTAGHVTILGRAEIHF